MARVILYFGLKAAPRRFIGTLNICSTIIATFFAASKNSLAATAGTAAPSLVRAYPEITFRAA